MSIRSTSRVFLCFQCAATQACAVRRVRALPLEEKRECNRKALRAPTTRRKTSLTALADCVGHNTS